MARSAWRLSDFFQIRLVKPRTLDVAPRNGEQVVLLLLRQLAHHLPGRAEDEDAIGDLLSFGDQAVRTDERAAADARAIHHHAVDADQAALADGAAVQHDLVADADVPAERHRVARIDVQHRAVLDVGSFTDRDLVIIGTDRYLEPHV